MRGIPISIKIFAVSVAVIIISIVVISISSYQNSVTIFEKVEKEQLSIIRDVKKNQIEKLYRNHFFAISSLSKLPDVHKLYNLLSSFYANEEDSLTKDSLRNIYEEIGVPINRFVRKQGYSNFFLISNANGQIIYSLRRGDDIGVDLQENEKYLLLKDTWLNVKKQRKIIITEYHPDLRDKTQLSCYMACPIISETGNNFASLIIEIPYSALDDIVQNYTGLGVTGELIIISKDSLVRNNLRFVDTSAYQLLLPPKNYFTNEKTNLRNLTDYRNKRVLSVSTNLDIPSLDWYLIAKIDLKEIAATQQSLKERLLLISIIILILMTLVMAIISQSLTKPIRILNNNFKLLKRGILSGKIPKPLLKDEVSEIADSFNTHIDNLTKVTNVANRISTGDVDIEVEEFGDKDEIGKALFQLSKNIQEARKEEERRKIEDEQRSWTANGIAKFTVLLHQEREDVDELGYHIIETLVEYVNANQGGLFLVMKDKDNKPYFEMIGSYAYNRRKFLKKQVGIKEGYIGACAIEKETIFMTDIPDDYIDITSGLGKENPKCLILVPLKSNEEVVGIFEIASFSILEKYQIEFIETIAKSTSNILSSVKNKIETEKLLTESNYQRNQLKQQEEEMRQNLEEMQSTQEELAKEQKAGQHLLEALNTSIYMVEYNLERKMITANEHFLKLLQIEPHHIINHYHDDNLIFVDKYTMENGYKHFWKDLHEGKVITIISKVKVIQKLIQEEFYLKETYIPIKDDNNQVIKFIKLAVNITDIMRK